MQPRLRLLPPLARQQPTAPRKLSSSIAAAAAYQSLSPRFAPGARRPSRLSRAAAAQPHSRYLFKNDAALPSSGCGYGIRAFSTSRRGMAAAEPRKFAPLGPAKVSGGGDAAAPKLRGVVFDVDGTLCEPQNYMFKEMRDALGIDKSIDILDHIYELPADEQEPAFDKIRAIERRAMESQRPQAGLVQLMDYLDSRGIPKGICTRNFDAPVNHLLTRFLAGHRFHPIVTRDFRPPKPDPAGILHIATSWGFVQQEGPGGDASGLIMVGDSLDDMTAGHRAGAATVLLVNEANAHLADHEHTDLCVGQLDELIDILERGFVGQIGQGDESPDTKAQAEEVLKRSA